MKAILNAGIPLRRRCRLILGCDEECGMQDLEYYEQKIGLPDMGFSPDANFPLINTEKGGLKLALHAALDDARLIEIASGTRVNVVPNQAVAVLAATGARPRRTRLTWMMRTARWKANWWTATPA